MHHGVTNLYWIIRGHDDLPIVAIVIPGAVPASGRGSWCSNYLFQPFSALYTLSIQHGVVGDDLEKVTGSSTMTTTCPQPLSTLETCLPQTLLCNTLLRTAQQQGFPTAHTHTHTSESQPPIHSKPVSRCGRWALTKTTTVSKTYQKRLPSRKWNPETP